MNILEKAAGFALANHVTKNSRVDNIELRSDMGIISPNAEQNRLSIMPTQYAGALLLSYASPAISHTMENSNSANDFVSHPENFLAITLGGAIDVGLTYALFTHTHSIAETLLLKFPMNAVEATFLTTLSFVTKRLPTTKKLRRWLRPI